jgi:hypothetical protein
VAECWPEEDDVFLALEEAEREEAVELIALHRGLKREVEVSECLDRGQGRAASGCSVACSSRAKR